MGKHTGSFLLGAIVGGVAAATAAILLTPKSGKEMRADLANQTNDLKEKVSDYSEFATEKTSELGQVAKEKVSTLSAQASDLAGNVKVKAADSFGKAKDVSGDVLQTLKNQTDDLSQHFKKTASELEKETEELKEITEDATDDIYIDVSNTAKQAKGTIQEGVTETKEIGKELANKAQKESNEVVSDTKKAVNDEKVKK